MDAGETLLRVVEKGDFMWSGLPQAGLGDPQKRRRGRIDGQETTFISADEDSTDEDASGGRV